jgi:hypothetical protein
MSKISAIRQDEFHPNVPDTSGLANKIFRPRLVEQTLHAELANFSSDELYELEDELNFYSFTGIASSRIKRLLNFL